MTNKADPKFERFEVDVLVKLSKKQRFNLFQKDQIQFNGIIYLIPEKNRIPTHRDNSPLPGAQ